MPTPTLTEAFRALRAALPDRPRIYVAGCAGAPLALADVLAREPVLAAGVTFLGVWIPGVNQVDWAGFHDTAQAETIFLSADLRPSFMARRTQFAPLTYTQAVQWLSRTPLDAAIAVLAPGGQDGEHHSLGVAADFTGSVLARTGIPALGLVNANMPTPLDGVSVPKHRFTTIVADDTPLLTVPPASPSASFDAIAANIVDLVDDGDTLQFGLGTVQAAVLDALSARRDLKIHSGMVSEPVLDLLKAGAIADAPAAITTGVALGSQHLYDTLAADARVRFAPVAHTHAIATLAAVPRLKAINSVIAVDLYGQANAEYLGPQLISGAGGLVDFLRGAAASPGGRGVLALPSSAKRGEMSRIVPRLDGPASVARSDVDTVVTEFGVAELKGRTQRERAAALVAIAHPKHQDGLRAAWRDMEHAQ